LTSLLLSHGDFDFYGVKTSNKANSFRIIINLAIYFNSFDFYKVPFLDKRTSENVSLSNFIRTSKWFGSFVRGSQGCLSKVKALFT